MLHEPTPGLRWLSLRSPTLPPATHTNCFILGSNELTVVDPGSPYPDEQHRLQEALTSLASHGHQVARVLLTHHHHDHIAGLEPFRRRGIPIWAHHACAALLTTTQAAKHIRIAHTPSDHDTLPHTPFTLLHTPGHAPGHLAIWHPPSRALICGDLMASGSTILIDPPEGDMHLYLQSLERVRALSPHAIYPAHGNPLPGSTIDTYIHHRLQREARILEAVRVNLRSLPDIVRHAYADTPAAAWPLAIRSAHAHLLRLRTLGLVHGDDHTGFSPS
jgi:ribonuclease/clavin/mitogillin